MPVDASPAWAELAAESRHARSEGLRKLCSGDTSRSSSLMPTFGEGERALALDVSLQYLYPASLTRLVDVAAETGLSAARAAMVAGERINVTENRSVSHLGARRSPRPTISAMLRFADAVRSGTARGAGGEPFERVVNIGIGGSELGPCLVTSALATGSGPSVRFAANIDPDSLGECLAGADPRRTLFVISSKTFTTVETMTNAARARAWLERSIPGATTGHFAAVTAEPRSAEAWGVDPSRVFAFDEGIGGRFSVSGPTGLPAAIAIGSGPFGEFLDGMEAMDEHFISSPAGANLPVVHGAVAVLNATVHGCRSAVVVPYSHRLGPLVAHLQQVMMESNGKSVDLEGRLLTSGAPALWGAEGSNAQHAFFQWLHQSPEVAPVEFVIVGSADGEPLGDAPESREARRILVANAFAQAEVLALGRTAEEVRAEGVEARLVPHKVFDGNRPSSKLLVRHLTPHSLGALLAMYEHSAAVQGWLWGVNSFDQFGVERGKELASRILVEDRSATGAAVGGTRTWQAAHDWLTTAATL